MADLDIDTVLGWRGKAVRDRDGEKIGTLGEVYLDNDTRRPAYAGVHTGLFGRIEHVVPLAAVTADEDGVRVPYAREQVHGAPQVDAETTLSVAQQQEVLAHYDGSRAVGGATDRGDGGGGTEMIRSEEEFEIRTRWVPRERVRVTKVEVVEHVEITVPVRREEIRLEHEPPPEGRIVSEEDAGEAPPHASG